MPNKKRFAVTGCSGFVGKNLVAKLGKENVVCIGRNDSTKIIDVDVIFHLAGEIKDESKMLESNVVLTYKLLSDNPNADFIYVGSSSEYGKRECPIKETDRLKPRTLYEATKGCGSLLTLSFANENRRAIVARPFSLYGYGEKEYRFFPTIYRFHKEKKKLKIHNGNHDWTYIDDFVNGLIMLSENGESGEIVNFGTGICTSNLDVVKTFEKVLDENIDYELTDTYINTYDSDKWVCDTSYAKTKYGFECKYSLEEGIRKFISSYSRN